MDLGRIVHFHRKKAGLSRVELARLAGLGKTIVYDLEHGRLGIGFANLMRICDVLNIKLTFSSPFMSEFERLDEGKDLR
ncbi:MAG: helix-turn-helix domain-containing protein [Chlamydiia bacterium]|nr:helix-turn-helix domain-containing protein [Chlamydiia bacterium]